jgi:hypothetical protein
MIGKRRRRSRGNPIGSRLTPADNRLAVGYFIALISVAVLVTLLLLPGDGILLGVLFMVVAVLILWHHSAAILLFMIQATLLIHEGPVSFREVTYNPVLLAIASLILIAIGDRFRTAWQVVGDGTIGGLISTSQATVPADDDAEKANLSKPSIGMVPRLLWLAAAVILTVATAASILTLVPEQEKSVRWLRLRPQELRAMTLGLGVLMVGVFTWHIVSAVGWRCLSPSQARVYLRSGITEWVTPDLRGAVRRRVKMRNRASQNRRSP